MKEVITQPSWNIRKSITLLITEQNLTRKDSPIKDYESDRRTYIKIEKACALLDITAWEFVMLGTVKGLFDPKVAWKKAHNLLYRNCPRKRQDFWIIGSPSSTDADIRFLNRVAHVYMTLPAEIVRRSYSATKQAQNIEKLKNRFPHYKKRYPFTENVHTMLWHNSLWKDDMRLNVEDILAIKQFVHSTSRKIVMKALENNWLLCGQAISSIPKQPVRQILKTRNFTIELAKMRIEK